MTEQEVLTIPPLHRAIPFHPIIYTYIYHSTYHHYIFAYTKRNIEAATTKIWEKKYINRFLSWLKLKKLANQTELFKRDSEKTKFGKSSH